MYWYYKVSGDWDEPLEVFIKRKAPVESIAELQKEIDEAEDCDFKIEEYKEISKFIYYIFR